MTAPSAVPSVKFNNGYTMPMFGLGTYLSTTNEVKQAVMDAIDAGYRHIDTARLYGNEKEVGEAVRAKIKDGTITRDDIFITTKLWNTFHKEEHVVPSCRKSVELLGLDYLDLYLMHFPIAYQDGDELVPRDANGKLLTLDIDYLETWRGMEECVRQGLTRSIGVSNFNSEQIIRVLEAAKIKPVNNQVEVNVNVNQRRLIEFCKKHDITVTGYACYGRPGNRLGVKNGADNPKVLNIAKKYNKTPAQIYFRYVFQLGAAPIPKSVKKSRIEENIKIFDFELTPEEITILESVGNGQRITPLEELTDHKYYPFSIPF